MTFEQACMTDRLLLWLLLLLLLLLLCPTHVWCCRWAVPITRDDLDMVCGIDGCF
jgi:hypothetical protein